MVAIGLLMKLVTGLNTLNTHLNKLKAHANNELLNEVTEKTALDALYNSGSSQFIFLL